MNEEAKKGLWLAFVTRLFGEEYVEAALRHPSAPMEPVGAGDVLLGEKCNEEEKFLYSFMPNVETGRFMKAESILVFETFCDLWWAIVALNHKLFGPLGVRKEWELVKPGPCVVEFVGELHMGVEGKEVLN